MARIDRGDVRRLTGELGVHRGRRQGRVGRLARYLDRFRNCVHYDAHRARGLPTDSREVESAHRWRLQKRRKLPGACWNPRSINLMLALRALGANGWWAVFWEQRNAA